jgi:hypothetical protein
MKPIAKIFFSFTQSMQPVACQKEKITHTRATKYLHETPAIYNTNKIILRSEFAVGKALFKRRSRKNFVMNKLL